LDFERFEPYQECSVILSEASLRAKSKDPHLVASNAWVADPSQAQDDIQPVEDPKRRSRTPITECTVILSEASLRAKSKDPHLVASSAWVADPSQVLMPCGHHRGMKIGRGWGATLCSGRCESPEVGLRLVPRARFAS